MAAELPPLRSSRAYWACQLAGWYGVAVVQVMVLYSLLRGELPAGASDLERASINLLKATFQGSSWWQLVLHLLIVQTAAMLLSHLLRGYIRRRAWATQSMAAKLPRVLLAGVLLSAPIGLAAQFTSIGALHPSVEGIAPWMQQLQQAIQWAPYYWAWMIVYFTILNQRRLRLVELQQSETARSLQTAELRLLKSQLNPHFLFNSLNSVRALIADEPARAQGAITQLARMLRYTLDSGQEEQVTLKQELEIVDDYLGLEALRLGERLSIRREIAPEAVRERIPVMLLQTVVENAIKHGIAELPAGGELHIAARIRDATLHIEVDNPRPQAVAAQAQGGIGLRNAAERLRLLYGERASLELLLDDAQLARARIRIPTSP